MLNWRDVVLFLTSLGSLEVACSFFEYSDRRAVWRMAREYADRVGKPMLNVGCGHELSYLGDYNLDIKRDIILPNHVRASVYKIPFPDKYFGSVFASHVIEHLENPKKALEEMSRVGERVFVLTPLPFKPSTWLNPDHRWVFVGQYKIRNNPLLNWTLLGLAIYFVGKY